jgi:hypothetical protein
MVLSDVLLLTKAKKVEKNTNDINMGTQTITEVRKEPTDKDPTSYQLAILGTQTNTFSDGEYTDKDQSVQFGTQTVTKSQRENTDSDRS